MRVVRICNGGFKVLKAALIASQYVVFGNTVSTRSFAARYALEVDLGIAGGDEDQRDFVSGGKRCDIALLNCRKEGLARDKSHMPGEMRAALVRRRWFTP